MVDAGLPRILTLMRSMAWFVQEQASEPTRRAGGKKGRQTIVINVERLDSTLFHAAAE